MNASHRGSENKDYQKIINFRYGNVSVSRICLTYAGRYALIRCSNDTNFP